MIKHLIAPIQNWLLNQGRCVACGELLKKCKKKELNNISLVTCRCGRMFVFDQSSSVYRRAFFDEI